MFREEYNAVCNAAAAKVALLKNNPLGYFVLSMLAGIYVGFGILLIFTIGGMMTGNPYAKIVMGAAFGIALSLVVMAGAELFTGNNFVMTAGVLKKKVTLADTLKLWFICYIGNLVGSILIGVIYHLTGLNAGNVAEFIASTSATKMSIPAMQLFTRGILCNMLVCLAIWCATKCKSESGKLIMIFWCLFAFITTGFEHSVANMTLLAVGILSPVGQAVTIGGYIYNLVVVSLGNMFGGILMVAIPYFLASKEKEV